MSKLADRAAYHFGVFSLDEQTHALTRDGLPIPLTPKEFQTLLFLVESAGKAVAREEILKRVWPDTFVGDGSLARNISVLRKHLGADAIETIPKFGYRFTLPVKSEPPAPSPPTRLLDPPNELPAPDNLGMERLPGRPTPFMLVGGAVALALAAALSFVLWKTIHRKGSLPAPVRVAVLPFRNVSPHPVDTDYRRSGFEDDLTARLGRLSYAHLRVLAKGSTSQYAETSKPPAQIADELGSRYLVEGTVSFDPNRAHVTAELIDATDQTIVWSREYLRPNDGMPAIQEEIVDSIAREIHVAPAPEQATGPLPGETSNPAAHDEYLLGKFEQAQKDLPGYRQALRHFQKAIALDPEYARAYTGIAECYIFMANSVADAPAEGVFPKARDAALTAIRLNGHLGDAHRDLAWLLFNEEANLGDAEAEYRKAISYNPDDARAHHWFAQLLMAERRQSEALQQAVAGYELDPRSVGSGYNYAFMLIEAGRPKEGVSVLTELAKREPKNEVIHCYLAIGYSRLRDYERSGIEFAEARDLSASKTNYEAAIAWTLAMRGKPSEAQAIVSDLERRFKAGAWVPGGPMVGTYIALGNKDRAFYWLQRGINDRSVTLLEANTDPIYSGLSDDPRFKGMIDQLHRSN